jgi:hypothetical protein
MLAYSSTAGAQSIGQLWGNVTIDWLASERVVLTLDVEPKVQVTPVTMPSRFANVDIWSSIDVAASGWFDAHGEFLTGFTNEQDGSNTREVTERMGVRLHILSRLIQERTARRGAEREAQPRRRGTLDTLLRFEHRELFQGDSPTRSSWRFRDRVELAYPLNRSKITVDGAVYLTSDTEFFLPVSNDPQEGHVEQWRLRNGLGYRIGFNMRLEALYVWTTKKNSTTGDFATDSQAIDLRVKLAF